MSLDEIKQISIRSFMEARGYTFRDQGPIAFCKSPFTRDSNWSFAYYKSTNSFYDWSSGFGGTIIDLTMAMDGKSFTGAVQYLLTGTYEKHQPSYKASRLTIQKTFDYTRYLCRDLEKNRSIVKYALSRGIHNGYELTTFPVRFDNGWEQVPSMGFLHQDETGKITGVKFRRIDGVDKYRDVGRYSARGKMGFFILENISTESFGEPTLYVVEGEINAITLWQYCQETDRNAVIISFGGVTSLPDKLPPRYDYIKDRRLIIDFDGDDELFSKRICLYSKYNLKPIKLWLDKGEDINSLYLDGEIKLIERLL